MPTNRLSIILAAAAFVQVSAFQAAAQVCAANSCTATNRVSVTVPKMMRLALDGSTTVVVSPTQADYQAGQHAGNGPVARVRANTPWKLQIGAARVYWTASGPDAREDKPASDLGWSTSPSGRFARLSNGLADVAAGNPTRETGIQVYYRTTLESDRPGTYSLVVRYTLVAS